MSVIGALRALYETMTQAMRRRLKWAFAGTLASGLFDVIGLALVLPLMQLLTDPDDRSGAVGAIARSLGDPTTSTLVVALAGAVLGAFLLKGIFNLVLRWWITGFIKRQQAEMSVELFERYMTAPYPFHLERNSAELIRTLDKATAQAYSGAVSASLVVASEGVTLLSALGVLLVARPVPALAAGVYFGILGVAFLRGVRRRANRAGSELMEASRVSTQAALQGLGGIKEVLVRGTAPYFLATYRESQLLQAEAGRVQSYLSSAPRYLIEMMFMVGVAVLATVTFAVSGTDAGASTLGLFVAAGFRMMPSLSQATGAVTTVRVCRPAIELVLNDRELLRPPAESVQPPEPLRLVDEVRVRDLRYRYDGSDHDVLHGVSFSIRAGESVALVGSSGAGKTTLVDIVLGLLQPTGGAVEIDGVSVSRVRERWQRSIGLVPQDVYLFDDSLRANIAFGEPDELIDEERMVEAVHRAQLDELVADLPKGLGTFVGERGVRLSGGQIQRIGIARALYLRPQLLVLDEATSALDNVTERKITSTIDALRGHVTMLVVAHRLSTVRRCDKLVFMSGGSIESIGTFDEVRDTNETFATLVRLGSLGSLENDGRAAS